MSAVDGSEVHVQLNGEVVMLRVRDTEPLVDALRAVGMNSVRDSCGLGVCGACTVLCDGVPISSCLSWAALAEGSEIRTAEGMADGAGLHPLQQAFIDTGAFQCGYCTPGMLLMARDLLDRIEHPSDEQIRAHLSGNICRCGCYPEIIAAVRQAAVRSRTGGTAAEQRTAVPTSMGAKR